MMATLEEAMKKVPFALSLVAAFAIRPLPMPALAQAAASQNPANDFRTSDRCANCHNKLKTSKGEDVSINVDWSASIMANSARDPYWQGSVRRETIDHPESSAAIQSECASCHMPLQYQQDEAQKRDTAVFSLLPLSTNHPDAAAAADGVSCTVCHQIQAAGLGTPATYGGAFTVAPPATNPRPLFGPYAPDSDNITKVHVMAAGYSLAQSDHIRDGGLCGSCHTLYTTARGPDGKPIGQLPEQMPYLEWQHSDYRDKQTCQQCHMPAVGEPVAVASLLGKPREGVREHTFVGANFLLEGMLGEHRDDLAVTAQPSDLAVASTRISSFLQSQSARVTLGPATLAGSDLSFPVRVDNLTGHKLPTAYPSRRAWLHIVVTAADGHIVFESGKLNPDGSIAGNANDSDPTRFSPHYTRITQPDQVQIFEPILGDSQGHVTTGLLSATQYLKDNRILPAGFDKSTASPDIAVHGEAAADPDFTAGSSTTHYDLSTNGAAGPFRIAAELIYQPVGYRWAHNLAPYRAAEPQQFVRDYDQAAARSAIVLAHAEATANAAQ
jgi:mono/diheme cytochrome c family protein